MWSRDEKRENRKTMRAARDRTAIQDNMDSNDMRPTIAEIQAEEDDMYLCLHELDENGWCPCDDLPRRSGQSKRRRPSAKWCRRKAGREHRFEFLEMSGLKWFRILVCQECGKKKYERRR